VRAVRGRRPRAFWALAVTLLALVGCSAAPGAHRLEAQAVIVEAPTDDSDHVFLTAPIDTRAVVVLISGYQRKCTGVAVTPWHIYTADHCLQDADAVGVQSTLRFVTAQHWADRGGTLAANEPHTTTVIARDAGMDRALLQSSVELEAFLDIAPVHRDEWVWTVVQRDARWEALLDTSGEPGKFAANVPIDHGDSGAPVINVYGQLVGITTNCLNDHEIDNPATNCDGGGRWRPFAMWYQ
jgi:hypothetical protein